MMVVIAVAGREATRDLAVFQIMEMRSIIGFAMLYPLLRASGGLAAVRTARPRQHVARNVVHYAAQYALVPRVVVSRVGHEFMIVAHGMPRPGHDPRLDGYFLVSVTPEDHRVYRRLVP